MIPVPAWLTALIYLVTDESKHFALSAFMGSLGFWSTWITLSAILWASRQSIRPKVFMAVAFGMAISSWLVGLSFAWASHWALDFVSLWWVTPLGPSLDLVKPLP